MINTSKKLPGPFLIDLKNKFREIAGEDNLIDRVEFQNGLNISNKEISQEYLYQIHGEKINDIGEIISIANNNYYSIVQIFILISQTY